MKKDNIFVATVADDYRETLKICRIGVEIDHFCSAENMDSPNFAKINDEVEKTIESVPAAIMHAPFNELYPAAIDPLALELAYKRLNQAYFIAQGYGIDRMVVHSGYLPLVHFKVWHEARSIEFWHKFMEDKGENFRIYVENVLEEEPHMMAELFEKINDPRIKMCFDTGHANCQSRLTLAEWVEVIGPYIGHVHLHNNFGQSDQHLPPWDGSAPMKTVVKAIERVAPETTLTLECKDSLGAYNWLVDNKFVKEM